MKNEYRNLWDVDTLMGRAEYPSFKGGTLFCQIEIQFTELYRYLWSNCRVDTPFNRLDLAILFQPEQCTGHLFLIKTGLLINRCVIHAVF